MNISKVKSLCVLVCIFSGMTSQARTYSELKKNCSGMISDVNCYQDMFRSDYRAPVDVYNVPREQDLNRKVFQGKKLIIDTEDQESCETIKQNLLKSSLQKIQSSEDLTNLCRKDSNQAGRYRSITMMWETDAEAVTPLKNTFFTSSESNLQNDTRNLVYMMAGAMGVLWLGPESISKWNKKEIKEKGFLSKWKDNVTSGPVMDKDDAVVNYIGHPITGAIYYTLARNQGSSMMESFGYSVMMSTFFWEYGVEAVAEIPSIQDLIVTPVIGSILGEVFYRYSKSIEANGGEVFGSKKIGKAMLFVLNPAGKISESINKIMSTKVVQESRTNLILARKKGNDPFQTSTNYIGLQLEFKYF